jgi:hypothetical protein
MEQAAFQALPPQDQVVQLLEQAIAQKEKQQPTDSGNNENSSPATLSTFQTYLRWFNEQNDPRHHADPPPVTASHPDSSSGATTAVQSAARISEVQGALDNVYLWALFLNKDATEQEKPMIAPVGDVTTLIRIYAQLGRETRHRQLIIIPFIKSVGCVCLFVRLFVCSFDLVAHSITFIFSAALSQSADGADQLRSPYFTPLVVRLLSEWATDRLIVDTVATFMALLVRNGTSWLDYHYGSFSFSFFVFGIIYFFHAILWEYDSRLIFHRFVRVYSESDLIL